MKNHINGGYDGSTLFIVIITFGVIFVVTSTFGMGLATTLDSFKLGLKGFELSQLI